MSENIIKTKRVVTVGGEEFDNPSAFERHRIQSEKGRALTTIKIKRADEPLKRIDNDE